MLTIDQKKKLLDYVKQYALDPKVVNQGERDRYEDFDQKRVEAIPILKALLDDFLNSKITIKEFKEKSEVLCRRYPYWGFKNFSGQMQLNQYTNNITDKDKEKILRDFLRIPQTDNEAKQKIDKCHDYLQLSKGLADNKKSIPRVSQQYLLSYFWEMQDHFKWITCYGSSRRVLLDLGFQLDMAESVGEEYVQYLKIFREIGSFFELEGYKAKYPLWFVEHVLWSQDVKADIETAINEPPVKIKDTGKKSNQESGISGEWTPDIVKDLIELSFNKETDWSKRRGLRPEKAFETKLRYAFTLLGYETKELGQGWGREPDGVALSMGVQEGDYAIVYDAKAREKHFSIGTNDREIYEYIQRKKEELRKNRINKLYFVVISSAFDEDSAGEVLRGVYRRTQVPVSLLKASDLLFIIDMKLQNVDIDHARMEDLFLETGIISHEKISDILGLR